MSISKSTQFVSTTIPPGRLSAAIQAAMESTGLVAPGMLKQVTVLRTLVDGSEERKQGVLIADIDSICDLSEEGLAVAASVGDTGPGWHYLGVHGGQPPWIHVQTPTAGVGDQMVQVLLATAGLDRYIEPPEVEASIEASADATPASIVMPSLLTSSPSAPSERRLRAFLSYRFGSGENEAAAALIQRFLELENVEVLTGKSYEPRPLHEKVADRLAGLDFLVLLVGADGESAWTRDEISTARALDTVIIPIVTDGAKFDAGLLGDLEYITVAPAHVADAVVPLLEALTYIRRRLT